MVLILAYQAKVALATSQTIGCSHVHVCGYIIIVSHLIHILLLCEQTLTWEVPGGIAASESLQIEVFDHETVGKNRCVCVS